MKHSRRKCRIVTTRAARAARAARAVKSCRTASTLRQMKMCSFKLHFIMFALLFTYNVAAAAEYGETSGQRRGRFLASTTLALAVTTLVGAGGRWSAARRDDCLVHAKGFFRRAFGTRERAAKHSTSHRQRSDRINASNVKCESAESFCAPGGLPGAGASVTIASLLRTC